VLLGIVFLFLSFASGRAELNKTGGIWSFRKDNSSGAVLVQFSSKKKIGELLLSF
jgi:hypothetical protein